MVQEGTERAARGEEGEKTQALNEEVLALSSAGALAGPYEGLEAEECGILDGCAHGRCVRVPEGFTCDCFDGYRLDMTRMACVGEGLATAVPGARVEALTTDRWELSDGEGRGPPRRRSLTCRKAELGLSAGPGREPAGGWNPAGVILRTPRAALG